MSKRASLVFVMVACTGCYDLTQSEREAPQLDAGLDVSDLPDSTAPEDPCRGIVCNDPPARSCSGANLIVVSEPHGYCVNDGGEAVCTYPNHVETCRKGSCIDGNCVDVPCQAAHCDEPPAPSCAGSKLVVHEPQGQCEASGGLADCSYASREIVCVNGCENGACVGEPCAGVVCNRPPARYCAGSSLVVWGDTGRCSDHGECYYVSDVVQCESGCEQGRCVEDDRCARTSCVSPPANYCLDLATLVAFEAFGTCSEGACQYDSSEIACPGGCVAAKCVDDPCAGVSCNVAPAPACDGEGLKVWAYGWGAAQCEGGVCLFPLETIPCGSGGCEHGACATDPCMAMQAYCSALSPWADYCVADTAVIHEAVGACFGSGVCRYESTEEVCSGGCAAGSCQ